MSEPHDLILAARHVTKKYPASNGRILVANNDVSLNFYRGRTLGVVGESGCGKSTFMRMVVSLEAPTEGEILYRGQDITKLRGEVLRQHRQKIQMVFQDPSAAFSPKMKIMDIVCEPLLNFKRIKKDEKEETARRLLEMVELPGDFARRYPHNMSGGQRQRLGIARALALQPSLIVCDEPVSALDVSIQAQILNLLMDLQDEMDLTYMFITHDLSVVKHISDDIAVKYLGQCVEKAPSKELFRNPQHPYTKALLSAIPVPSLSARKNRPELIKGEVSDPIDPKPGCRFAKRCPHCTEACTLADIPLKEVAPNHFVACVLAQQNKSF